MEKSKELQKKEFIDSIKFITLVLLGGLVLILAINYHAELIKRAVVEGIEEFVRRTKK